MAGPVRSNMPAVPQPAGSADFGNLPLPRGQVTLTPYTRRNLEAAGWKEGDPIPGDLGDKLKEIQASIAEEAATVEYDPALQATVRHAKPVEISSLPPEKQAELRAYLADYKQQMAAQDAYAAAEAELTGDLPDSMHPSVRDAVKAGARAAMSAQSQGPTAEIVQSQPVTQPAAAQQPVPQPVTVQQTHTLPEHQHVTASLPNTLPICPRCLWDLSQPFEVPYTERDKQSFLAAMLGLQRFSKAMSVMGGKMVLVFRTLTNSEVQTINRQLTLENRAGTIQSEAEYFLQLMTYRMCCALKSVSLQDNEVADIPPLAAWAAQHVVPAAGDPATKTPLPQLLEWFLTTVLEHDSVRRIVANEHRKFQRLVEGLEVMASAENFWSGIEPQI